ncbi:hypothetical protein [Mycolicibacter virginiensis]|uniref:hypothetical protein n=1 Tax=Mycolicibacter virginiensis TaxID=1795032 RepID=UPI001F04FC7B|nr:hypothetical protein [Mycolicibacter virginiensis]ULP48018.1 hypothetical protein MJO54_02280 [Mycolicibacter virginiensis]
MSEYPDTDFSFLSTGTGDRAKGVARGLDADGGAVSSGVADLDGQAKGLGLTAGLDGLVTTKEITGRAAMSHASNAESVAELSQLASQWQSSAPKNADIDQADGYVQLAQLLMMEAEERNDPVGAADAEANFRSAVQQAQSLRAMRESADAAFNTGAIALAAKVNQRVDVVNSDSGGTGVRRPDSQNSLGALKPPAPSTPRTPSAPGTPAGPAPSAPAGIAPHTQLSKADMPPMPQVPQGQAQPQQPQAQQQPHPQAAAAGGAPTGAPTPKPADRKRDSDAAPTGLSAAVGATGAGASPVSSAAAPRPTNPGYSREGMVTGTNVTGRPSPQVTLSGGMPATAPATAAGTAAAPGAGGMPYGPGAGGMGASRGGGAAKEAPRIVQSAEPLEDGIVRGGTILRGDEPPEQKAS